MKMILKKRRKQIATRYRKYRVINNDGTVEYLTKDLSGYRG